MYTTTGEKLTWKEFEERRNNGEQIFIGDYPKEDQQAVLQFAHQHTVKETEQWLIDNDFTEDIMYTKGRPTAYDKWSGECAGVRCLDGWIWN
jgi:hypothetical protein